VNTDYDKLAETEGIRAVSVDLTQRIAALTTDGKLQVRIFRLVIDETGRAIEELRQGMRPETGRLLHEEMTTLAPELCARKAHCSRRTIDRAIESGALLSAKGSSGLICVDRESFDEWNAARTPKVAFVSKVVAACPKMPSNRL
jgi:hypothetical protein